MTTTQSLEHPGCRPGTRARLWLAAILLLAVAARAISFSGFAGSDDSRYTVIAAHVARGEFPPERHGTLPQYPQRLGIILPTALAFAVAGVREWAMLVYPVAISLGTVLLAFAAGRYFFGTRAGLIAAALYALIPLDCRFATWLLTDAPAAFWAGGGVLLCYLGFKRERMRARILLGLAAGLCFGVSWLTRMSVAYLAPFVGGFLIYAAVKERRCAWLFLMVAIGSAAVLVGEGLLYAATHGDFFHRIRVTESMYAQGNVWYFKPGTVTGWRPGEYWFELFKRLIKTGPVAVLFNWKIGLVPLLACVAIGHALRRRDSRGAFVTAWFLAMALMYNFGSVSVWQYQPLPPIAAYLYPLLLPGVLLVGGWADFMLAKGGDIQPALLRERAFWAVLVLAVGLLASAWGIFQNLRTGIGCRTERQVYSMVRPQDALYTDSRTINALCFFWQYPDATNARDFADLSAERIPRGSRVLVNPRALTRRKDLYGYRVPAFVKETPRHWTVKWRDGSAVLYEVGTP